MHVPSSMYTPGFPLFPVPELDENIGNGTKATVEWIRVRGAERTPPPPSGSGTLKPLPILGVRPAADLFRGGGGGPFCLRRIDLAFPT